MVDEKTAKLNNCRLESQSEFPTIFCTLKNTDVGNVRGRGRLRRMGIGVEVKVRPDGRRMS